MAEGGVDSGTCAAGGVADLTLISINNGHPRITLVNTSIPIQKLSYHTRRARKLTRTLLARTHTFHTAIPRLIVPWVTAVQTLWTQKYIRCETTLTGMYAGGGAFLTGGGASCACEGEGVVEVGRGARREAFVVVEVRGGGERVA